MAKEKKLTVKGIFGDDLKKIKNDTSNLSALYLLIIFNRKSTKVKSYTLNVFEDLLDFNFRMQGLHDLDYLVNHPDYDYQSLIEEDINLLNTCKMLYEKYCMREFDIKFLSSPAFSILSGPVDFYIMQKLSHLSIEFFGPKNFPKTNKFLFLLDQRLILNQISSLKETSPRVFEKLISNEIFNLYYILPKLLFSQRIKNQSKFYYLTDCLDEDKFDSLFDIDFLNSEERAHFKRLTLEIFQSEISNIFQNHDPY